MEFFYYYSSIYTQLLACVGYNTWHVNAYWSNLNLTYFNMTNLIILWFPSMCHRALAPGTLYTLLLSSRLLRLSMPSGSTRCRLSRTLRRCTLMCTEFKYPAISFSPQLGLWIAASLTMSSRAASKRIKVIWCHQWSTSENLVNMMSHNEQLACSSYLVGRSPLVKSGWYCFW